MTAATWSVANGRASADIVKNHYWGTSGLDSAAVDACSALSLALLSAAVFSALGSAFFAKRAGKGVAVWAAMGLLGGPSTVAKIREGGL